MVHMTWNVPSKSASVTGSCGTSRSLPSGGCRDAPSATNSTIEFGAKPSAPIQTESPGAKYQCPRTAAVGHVDGPMAQEIDRRSLRRRFRRVRGLQLPVEAPAGVGTVGVDDEDLRVAVAVACESDLGAIGRPGATRVVGGVLGQWSQSATVGVHHHHVERVVQSAVGV